MLEKHKGSAGNYWLENDGVTVGPRLTECLAVRSAQSLARSVVLYSHGEQDSGFTTSTALATEVAEGMTQILSEIRTAILPSGPNALPVWWDMLGPRYSANELNEYRLRDAMITEIDSLSRNFRGAEKYALLLDSSTHPTETNEGYGRMGAWTGRKIVQWLKDLSELRGPSISGTVRTGNDVAVTISTPAGKTLVKPDEPDFFGLFDVSDNRISITNYSWDGDVLTITGETQPAKMRYPARKDGSSDITRVIRLSDPSDPLFTGEPGLPLESIQTVVF